MGRDCGLVALNSGIAAGAMAICIPEVPFDEDEAIDCIMKAKEDGKRGMIVVISEGVFTTDENGKKIPYGEILKKKIEEKTGIETKFARFAHVMRGGSPTLRDRLTATKMGKYAVDLLLDGKSDVVVCEKSGKLVATEIKFALIVDRMFKGKLKDGDLDKFSDEEVELMKKICAEKQAMFEDMMDTAILIANN
jgi:6-phosphofructokinase 1